MCIIIAKPAGVKLPPLSNIIEACTYNRDGYSFATVENGKIVTFRSLDLGEFISYYLTTATDAAPFLLHARIATHGTINKKNTHNFPALSGKLTFCHNGVISGINCLPGKTDSETFYRNIFVPLFKVSPESAKIAAETIQTKFAWMTADGDITTTGAGWITDKNIFYSNSSYQRRQSAAAYCSQLATPKRASKTRDLWEDDKSNLTWDDMREEP